MNQSGPHPASKAPKANSRETAPRNEHHAMTFCAGIRSSASAPPISGEKIAQTGGMAKASGTQEARPSAFSKLVSAGIQNPGAIPWKNESSQSRAKTPLRCLVTSTLFDSWNDQ